MDEKVYMVQSDFALEVWFSILQEKETTILAHPIRISEILPWVRKAYLTHAILPRHVT